MNGNFAWDFPGGWYGLGSVFLILLAVSALSAWTTRRPVGTGIRLLMTLTRAGAFALLLFCLCAPRIEWKKERLENRRYRIAVLTDDSGSMRKKGFWKRSRLQDARRYLDTYLRGSSDGRLTWEYFHFSDTFRKGEAAPSGGGETDLFGMLEKQIPQLENSGFDGVICLTDGIDTLTCSTPENAYSALAGSRMRILFVPITTVLEAAPSLIFRKIEAPTLAYLNTEIPLNFMIRRVNAGKRMNPRLRLLRNGTPFGEFLLENGSGFQTVTTRIPVRNPGTDRFTAELILNERTVARQSWSMEKTLRKTTRRILVYNGALEYGNRFLKNVFLDDPSVKLDLVFAPGVIRSKNARSPIRFERAGELEKYDVIVLFNLNRSQTSPEMERVLREYVEKGGGIIFITGNPMIAAEFANSPLEKLLPVTFSERYNAQKRYDVRTAGIVRLIASGRRRPTDFDRALQRNSEMRYKEHPLHDFVLTRIGRESPIFKRTLPDGSFRLITPRFEDYAPVSGVKPAANVLAEFRDAEGKAHVLLAYQNFGQGRCMVLATDPLWRWKLKTSSKDPSFEVFWKNLFSWLALGRDNDSRWKIPNLVMTSGHASEMDFFPGSGLSPATPISFTLENGKKEKQNLSAVREGGRYHFSIPFPASGEYRVVAESEGRELASAAFSVSEPSSRSGEEAALEPDLERLEEFSRLPNVSLLSAKEAPDFSMYFPAEHLELEEESIFPLWNRAWIYLLIVGLILLEYWIRRRYGKLV